MTIDEFIQLVQKTAPPVSAEMLAMLEASVGTSLPDDYRQFLIRCNGGYIGGALWFSGPTPAGEAADAGVHHIGGLRDDANYSLAWHQDCYAGRIPRALMWIMDDPFGNAICLGISQETRGRIYFWDHEAEPDKALCDGEIGKAGNVSLIANSFKDFVAGLKSV
jgi:hypothetical protein